MSEFKVGDEVIIMTGKYRSCSGVVVTPLDKWNQVAVRLNAFNRVFRYNPKSLKDYFAEQKEEAKPSTNILDEANAIAGKDRAVDYGHPGPNLSKVAALWNTYATASGMETRFTAKHVAMMMILMKVVRHLHSPKRDNLVDIAGYGRCVELIEEWEGQIKAGADLAS